MVASVTVNTSALVFTIVALLPNLTSLPVTVKLPATVVRDNVPAAIETSNSPLASPSSITKPAVEVPSCSATETVTFPPSCPFAAILTCDLISAN